MPSLELIAISWLDPLQLSYVLVAHVLGGRLF